MVTVERLLGVNGDARHILNLSKDEIVEWTAAEELSRLEVIRGIQFNKFSVYHANIGLNFVECGFNQCLFKDLRTDGHFWGAGDRWNDCAFERCHLFGVIAPANSFNQCRFEQVAIMNFRPHQTLFDRCSFKGGAIEGLRAHLISNSQVKNDAFEGTEGQLFFRDCRFDGIAFRGCYFEGAVFRRCQFTRCEASECSFEGISADVVWWGGAQESDPFTVFLTKALELIRDKCGPKSAAYHAFENYIIDYGAGRTTSKDFSACLYADSVPYLETQKIIKDLRKLVVTFPF